MFPLQFSFSRENFGNNRIRTEHIHESSLRKLVFIEQLSNKFDAADDGATLPKIEQIYSLISVLALMGDLIFRSGKLLSSDAG